MTNTYRSITMASLTHTSISLLLLLLLSTTISTSAAKTTLRHPHKTEKLTHFRLYWHDIQTGKSPTSIPIIKPANSTFGWTNIIDNPLTAAPDIASKLLGRAQGFYSIASQQEIGLLMAMTFAFSDGKYNGSTITVLGRNPVMNKVREMPVVGGTGLFRFARGYVEARTHTFDMKTGNACVEYHCYVLHF